MPEMKVAKTDGEKESTGVRVKRAQLQKVVRASLQLVAKRSANANPLFGENVETVTALFTLSRIPDKRKVKPVLIPLPHPLFGDKSEVCIFSKDPQARFKELLLQEHKVPGITKVIGMEKLRKHYRTFDSKRSLADAFDLFLCDSDIVEMMPQALGATFYRKKNKPPIPVKINPKDPKPAIEKALGSTTLRVPLGPCVGVKIGRCSMSEEQLVENAATVIKHVARHFVGNPLQSINLQATAAPALPVWRRDPTPGEPLDLKKYASEAGSSVGSDTGVSATPTDTDAITSDLGDALSELDTWSDAVADGSDAEVGIIADEPAAKKQLPLVQGLAGKKRKQGALKGKPAKKLKT
jgi:ribosome biogenesis protein UTP30